MLDKKVEKLPKCCIEKRKNDAVIDRVEYVNSSIVRFCFLSPTRHSVINAYCVNVIQLPITKKIFSARIVPLLRYKALPLYQNNLITRQDTQ